MLLGMEAGASPASGLLWEMTVSVPLGATVVARIHFGQQFSGPVHDLLMHPMKRHPSESWDQASLISREKVTGSQLSLG